MYRITENAQYGSREIYFDAKPSTDVIDKLKSLKLRWNPKKKCWYGFASESEMISAINGAGEDVVTDGYMGGGAFYGSRSNQFLYGSDLSKAIREALKAAGIRGVTVSCKTYSGGQSITATVKTTEADFVGRDEYIANYEIKPSFSRIWTGSESIFVDDYYNMPGEKQEEIRKAAALANYEKSLKGISINEHYIEKYNEFTPSFLSKLEAVNNIIKSFNYNESNAMVDYFNTNFYWDIDTKACEA